MATVPPDPQWEPPVVLRAVSFESIDRIVLTFQSSMPVDGSDFGKASHGFVFSASPLELLVNLRGLK